jgi:hypothetical protein
MDAVLEPTKQQVLDTKKMLDEAGIGAHTSEPESSCGRSRKTNALSAAATRQGEPTGKHVTRVTRQRFVVQECSGDVRQSIAR